MAQQLLRTKFHLPSVRAEIVRRPRLTDLIDRGLEGPLTLISAPAGTGKSTLVGEWRESDAGRNRQFAWLSLDPADSDPVRFFTYFAAALDGIRPGTGDAAASLFRASNIGVQRSEILTALINEIAEIKDDFVLGLDDYHAITDEHVHEMMATFVEHMPSQMHLLIATRHDPPLPLARLRARGGLTEIRGPELQFDVEEAVSLLAATEELDLPKSVVTDLTERTEGWAAGLHLFALSVRGRKMSAAELKQRVGSFSGSQKFVFDYLAGEIFGLCDEPTRDFLVKTSLLERMTGPLCDQVTGTANGVETLSRLADQNLFLVPLDDERRWYRYHHLFQDFLRSRAGHLTPQDADEVWRRAAAWFEDNGMAAEAIEQARAAGDHETVARLLAANFEEFQRIGHYASISRWSASLPDEMVQKRPRMALIHALSALATEDNNEAVRRLTSWAENAIKVIEDGGGFDPSDDVDGTVVGFEGLEALKGELLALKLVHSIRKLSREEVTRIACQALELLPTDKHRVRGMIHLLVAGIQMELGDMKSALPILERGADEARRAESPGLLAGVLAYRGQVSVAMGRLEDGRRSFEDALSVGRSASAEANWLMCGPHTWIAEVLLERADLAGATDHAAKALASLSRSPMRRYVLYGHTTAAQVFMAAGDTGAAIEQLEEAQEFARGASNFRFSSFLSSVKLKIYCGTGDLEAAADVVRERDLSPDVAVDYKNEEEMTAYARYLVARGDCGDAEQVLSRVVPIVRDGGRVQHEIHALALRALAYELSGERALALESLGRATMLGQPGRFNRTFTGEGPVMAGLLEALADAMQRGRGPAESGSPSYLENLLREMGAVPDAASLSATEIKTVTPRDAALASLPEPLSEREIEVLRLIASGASNQQIAEQLVVSMSTIKTHINRTYRKLDARSRTQAVAVARQLGIV